MVTENWELALAVQREGAGLYGTASTTHWRQFIRRRANAENDDVGFVDVAMSDFCGSGVRADQRWRGRRDKLGRDHLRLRHRYRSGIGRAGPGTRRVLGVRGAGTQSGGACRNSGGADSWIGVHRVAGAVHARDYLREGGVRRSRIAGTHDL